MSETNIIFSDTKTADFEKYTIILYIIEGLFITIFNVILTIRLFSDQSLRTQKEFVVIGSCLIFDIFFGLGYFCAGVYRLVLISAYDYFPLVSMWDCFITPHTQFMILITIVSGFLLLATALDRFICVFFPFTYIKLHVEYAYYMMILPYLLVIPLWIPGAVGAYQNAENQTFTMACFLNQSINAQVYITYRAIRIFCTSLCVFIYAPIFVKMCTRAQSIHKQSQIAPGSTRNRKRLRSMTTTAALITGSTLLLYTVPDVILNFFPFVNSNVMYIMNLNKGVLNVIIFLVTQKTLRELMYPSKKYFVSDSSRNLTSKTTIATIVK